MAAGMPDAEPLRMVRELVHEHLVRNPRVQATRYTDPGFRMACEVTEVAVAGMVQAMLGRGADRTTVRLTVRDALEVLVTDRGMDEFDREFDPVTRLAGMMPRMESGPIVYRRTTT